MTLSAHWLKRKMHILRSRLRRRGNRRPRACRVLGTTPTRPTGTWRRPSRQRLNRSTPPRPALVAEGPLRRSLNDAQAQWVSWRNSECQDVAPFEENQGMDHKGRGSAPALHYRLQFRARIEPQGALSLSCNSRRSLSWVSAHARRGSGPAEGGRLWRLLKVWAMSSTGLIADRIDARTRSRFRSLRAREDARALLIARDMPLLRNAGKGPRSAPSR